MAPKLHAKIGIVGGGPAGAALAMRLARAAHNVVLLADGGCRYGVQGFSERTLATLRELNATRALAVLKAPARRQVRWNGRTSHASEEYLIERGIFDRALLDDARASGAEIIQTRAPRVPASGESILIRCGAEKVSMSAELWVDARGRGSPGRAAAAARGPATLALLQALRAPPGAPRSAILSVADGWFWIGILADGTGAIQQSLDLRRSALAGGRDRSLIDALAARVATLLPGILRAAKVTSPVRGHPASLRLSAASECALLAGDALLAADPLSGQGVYEALAGSRHLAAAINTLVRTSTSRTLVARFLAERARERFDILAGLAVHAHREETRWSDHCFWAARQSSIAQSAPRPSRAAILHGRPVLDRDQVIEASVLVTPRHPRGVWRYCDVPVVTFLCELRSRRDTTAAARALGVPPELARRVGQWLAEEIPGFEV